MKLSDLPLVSLVQESGPDDPVFDLVVLVGPLVVLLIAILGRSVFTNALAALYIIVVVTYVGWLGLT